MQTISFLKKLLRRNHTYVSRNSIHWFGTEYGGFYLDKSLLTASSICFSFGVGEDISFDLAVSRLGCKNIFLFDPTPKSIEFISKKQLPEKFRFYSYGVSDKDEKADFFLPKSDDNVSGSLSVHKYVDTSKVISVDLKKLSTIMCELDIGKIDVLKMDIEGSEYKVLKNIMNEGIYPSQICVEFHNGFYKNGKELFEKALDLLKQNSYDVGAISQTGKEFLFIKKQAED